jgi:hypothetical protein
MAPQAYFDTVTVAIDMSFAKSYDELIPAVQTLLKSRLDGRRQTFALHAALPAWRCWFWSIWQRPSVSR